MRRSAWRYLWKSYDIRRKLLITILILTIYRVAAHVPVPGVDREAIRAILSQGGPGGTLFGLLDMLSGGTVSQFSVLAMGVYPYITAQIIIQLLVPIIPSLQRKMQEDQREGRRWMEKWTYILAVPMAALNAIGQINIFSTIGNVQIIPNFGFTSQNWLPSLAIVISMTAGTMFAIWLGELISEFGIRNQGLSLIIFSGIVSSIPATIQGIIADRERLVFSAILMILITVATIFLIVVVQQGRRNIPVMYPGRRVGSRMSMPVKGTLPLMVNMAGMIPLIFAQSFLTFPSIIASFFTRSQTQWVADFSTGVYTTFSGEGNAYWIMYFALVVIFSYFYTDILFNQQNYGDNLKRVGAQIPGVSQGAPTQRYLTRVLRRISLPGALFLGIVAILPWFIGLIFPFAGSTGLMLVSSAGLLIVVGVVRDTFYNIDAELKLHGYDETLLVR
jgi:preprotein translocase subunit SecY